MCMMSAITGTRLEKDASLTTSADGLSRALPFFLSRRGRGMAVGVVDDVGDAAMAATTTLGLELVVL